MQNLGLLVAPRALLGLAELGYFGRVGAQTLPVLPDALASIVWRQGQLLLVGPHARAWSPRVTNADVAGVRLAPGPFRLSAEHRLSR